MGVALGAQAVIATDYPSFAQAVLRICDDLAATRPTAVNLFWAIERMRRKLESLRAQPVSAIKQSLINESQVILEEDIQLCKTMGRHGAALVRDGHTILTHCNAGSLATAGYGTALGVIRAAHEQGKKISVIADETRPVLQGSRLTAWELMQDRIPVTLITDNMAGSLMQAGENSFRASVLIVSLRTGMSPIRSGPIPWQSWQERTTFPSMSRLRIRRSISKQNREPIFQLSNGIH